MSELFYTERSHLRKLKVLDAVFYQRMNRDGILPPEDIKHIFVNLEEIIQLHGKRDPLLSARLDISDDRLSDCQLGTSNSFYDRADDGHQEEERDVCDWADSR